MTDAAPAVALLFDDLDLGAQLRDALQKRGAHIVHEGGIASLSQARLNEVAADVVVVNLDDTGADALDHLYSLIDGDRPRVVFNDAQATRGLAGWDRDRWARHLAVKVLQAGDVDPPRPADARELDIPAVVTRAATLPTDVDGGMAAEDETAAAQTPPAWPDPAALDAAQAHVQRTNSESESLSAELEALLASAELSAGDGAVEDGGALFTSDGQDPPRTDLEVAGWALLDDAPDELAPATPDFQLDEPSILELSVADASDTPEPTPSFAAPVGAPTNWALLDGDAPAAGDLPRDADKLDSFAVEKLSAADFLAPQVAQVASSFEPVMNLELVSMEEAVAPLPIHVATEIHLDELHMALSRLVLTGAAADGAAAAVDFFAAVPATSHLTFLHIQHLQGQSAEGLVGQMAGVCALKVRLATDGSFTQPGEVLVAPPGQQVRVHRDGRVQLQPGSAEPRESSIDDSFKLAAEGFGRDALAIVFSGHGVDALAGAQAIRERGGSVWVETASGGYGDMAGDIDAEGLVNFSGTPPELAARLLEVFP